MQKKLFLQSTGDELDYCISEDNPQVYCVHGLDLKIHEDSPIFEQLFYVEEFSTFSANINGIEVNFLSHVSIDMDIYVILSTGKIKKVTVTESLLSTIDRPTTPITSFFASKEDAENYVHAMRQS